MKFISILSSKTVNGPQFFIITKMKNKNDKRKPKKCYNKNVETKILKQKCCPKTKTKMLLRSPYNKKDKKKTNNKNVVEKYLSGNEALLGKKC